MTEPLEPDESAESIQSPGRVRTWWHPLLVNLLKRRGDSFVMQHTEVPAMDRTWEQLRVRIVQGMTLQEKAELLMRPEVLDQIPPEKLLESLTPEQIVGSLDANEREQLRRLLDQAAGDDAPNQV